MARVMQREQVVPWRILFLVFFFGIVTAAAAAETGFANEPVWRILLLITHFCGVAVGVGGATFSDFMFFKSIHDGRISDTERGFLELASHIVIAALIILILSGIGLVYAELVVDGASPRLDTAAFHAKITAVLLIAVNGFVFHWKIFPLMEEYGAESLHVPEIADRLWLFAGSGTVSLASWYAAMIFALAGRWNLPFTYVEYIGMYAAVILAGTGIGYYVLQRKISSPPD